jgi:predicted amidohydrolase YtcJ
MVRHSHAPRVYRELEREGALDLRVRINYWSDHLDAAIETGLRTNHGGGMVAVGGIKTFTDGSFGGRTAKVTAPYADAPDGEESGEDEETGSDAEGGGRGQWVVGPEELREVVERAHAEGFQVCTHAIGDEAIEETLSAYEAVLEGNDGEGPAGAVDGPRHRIEHFELASHDQIDRLADAGVVASMQPNFLQWAGEGGLYDQRLGETRRKRTNRLRTVADAGADLAFGSDCMPLDPLLGVHHAVNAPVEPQRLSVTEALRAYTLGGARAGFDEDRLGTVEPGKLADLVVLERSPWEHPEAIDDIEVHATVVDGRIVYGD